MFTNTPPSDRVVACFVALRNCSLRRPSIGEGGGGGVGVGGGGEGGEGGEGRASIKSEKPPGGR